MKPGTINRGVIVGWAGIIMILITLAGCGGGAAKMSNTDMMPPPEGSGEGGLNTVRFNCREYQYRGQEEREGLGLYSYVLFNQRPVTADDSARYRAMYENFKAQLPKYAELRSYDVSPKELNVVYWPLDTLAPAEVLETKPPDFFITHYDYARAAIIITRLKEVASVTGGPLILVSNHKLNYRSGEIDRSEVLVMNFARTQTKFFKDKFQVFQDKVLNNTPVWTSIEEMRIVFVDSVSRLGDMPVDVFKMVFGGE